MQEFSEELGGNRGVVGKGEFGRFLLGRADSGRQFY